MNVEDTHLINYSLKKLQVMGVVASHRNGKEVTYAPTPAGEACVDRYLRIREACLMSAFNGDERLGEHLGEMARLLRVLSGLYDQAARSASSY